jgi:hypothetical protein
MAGLKPVFVGLLAESTLVLGDKVMAGIDGVEDADSEDWGR